MVDTYKLLIDTISKMFSFTDRKIIRTSHKLIYGYFENNSVNYPYKFLLRNSSLNCAGFNVKQECKT